jgi:uncharacterized protein
MKVVVDTNVFASGVFWKGPPYQILQAWERGQIKLVVSPPILDEYRRVLIELAVHRPGVKYERSLELVGLHAEVVTALAFARPVCTDPDDDIFLATALSAGVEYIVSGDKALLAQNGFRGLHVVPPRAFLSQLK